MAFGLENARLKRNVIDEQVRQAATMLRVDKLLDRKPTQLPGGQRQRVAIGRAMVREPKIFLFDEPLSNLDAELRVSMRAELRDLHRRLGATMIYVTHDQVEAMTLADRIVVLRDGRIEQVGTPQELYERPCNTFVAGFIGSPRMNFIPAHPFARALGVAAHASAPSTCSPPRTIRAWRCRCAAPSTWAPARWCRASSATAPPSRPCCRCSLPRARRCGCRPMPTWSTPSTRPALA